MNIELTASKTEQITGWEQLKNTIRDYIEETTEHSNLTLEFDLKLGKACVPYSVEIMYNMHYSHPCSWVVALNGEDTEYNITDDDELDDLVNFLKKL